MTADSVTRWLISNGSGTVGEIMRGAGLTLDTAQDRLDVLEIEGVVERFAYRWDGSPVYRLIMETEHNAKDVMQRYGVVTREGLAGYCDECGEWWNPLEQIAMNERDWFLCRSCMATFLLGR